MRTPNSEQKKAIEHLGGVILKAGAGSGKTFVLVEHIVYLINNLIKDNADKKGEEFLKVLSTFFSKIVLMTFTKKAAGELETRIREKVNFLAQGDPKWSLARDQLGHLNISTIHGFCHKLLTQGYITDLSPDIDILTDIEYKSKIEGLIDDWIQNVSLTPEFEDLFFGHKRELADSFFSIFQSPELRSAWSESDPLISPELNIENFLKEMLFFKQIHETEDIDFENFKEHSSLKWYEILKGYHECEKENPLNNLEAFLKHCDFFESIKRLSGPSKKLDAPDLKLFYEKIKRMKAFLKEHKEQIVAFYQGDKTFFNDWYKLLKGLFDHIDKRIPYFHGLNYSDLEYYTLRGLQNPQIAQKIRKNYSYFIVDEFQDTSPGQFKIIDELIGGDFNKLFCVGDLKQAIYGFRGGEIQVFKDCEKVMPKALSLSNNYRSDADIISFCNDFFKLVFALDAEFKENVGAPFEVEAQVCPDDKLPGEIIRSQINVDDTGKIKDPEEKDIEVIEALSIIKRIEEIQKKYTDEEICILYRALSPSKYLIHFLLEEQKAFLAQIKIPYNEDPILGMFKVLLECNLNNKEEITKNYYNILVKGYLKHLKIPVPENLNELLKIFSSNLPIIGTLEAYRSFFFSLGLSNSNHTHNMKVLSSLININAENVELIWDQIKQGRNDTYSFEFQLGKGGNKLRIMTVHGSKGLEFDHVILGGIHVVGKRGGSSPILGKGPSSLQWKQESKQGKFYFSPGYLLEKEIIKLKESSESKRLLYVACTRSKNSLSWMDINIGGEPYKYGKDPWILAFRKAEGLVKTKAYEFKIEELYKRNKHFDNATPFFHKGAQGMALKIGHEGHKLGTLSELSVTRLATLIDCPRKFYLQNICRLEEGALDTSSVEETEIKSSSKRGTRIHATIAQMIEEIAPTSIKAEDKASIDFANSVLAPLKDLGEFISEKQIKFPLFGYMCSGIPDLMVVPKGSDLKFKIIDFKTGKLSDDHLDSYWFQLACYAHGAYYFNLLEKTEEIALELLFLDVEKKRTKSFNYPELEKFLFNTWENLNDLSQVKLDHCPTCKFKNTCYPSVAGRPSYDKIN